MAIAFDNSYGGTIAASESVSRSFTIGSGSDRYLLAALHGAAASEAATQMTSVQYNGVAMNYLGEAFDLASGDYVKVRLYYLDEGDLPAAGAYNFTCTANASLYAGGVHLLSLDGVAAGAPEVEAYYQSTVGQTSWSHSITTLTDGAWVTDWFTVWNGNTLAANGGQTERSSPVSIFGNYNVGQSTELQPTAGSETQGWTWTLTSVIELHVLFSLAPAGVSGEAENLWFRSMCR